jgi:beta-lactamase regulating signal transducer with metallopeptidase domain
MSGLLGIVTINACMAVAMAVLVTVATRFVKRPSLIHAMWLVVLLELLVPPVVGIGVLPTDLLHATATVPGGAEAAIEAGAWTATPAASLPAFDWKDRVRSVLIIVWLTGVALILGLAVWRVLRFRRLLARPTDAPRHLQRRLKRLAVEVGVARAPLLRMVSARISPCIWFRPGGVELLFPLGLTDRLTSDEIDALLTHELAHVARKDHWVRYLELIASALFWWHPVVWWARSRLRRVEERCCDQIVLRRMTEPGVYARGLLKTVEYLVGTGRPVPALASGAGEARQMEERLTMIMNERPPSRPSRTARLAWVVLALGLLLVFPTWNERSTAAADSQTPASRDAQAADDRSEFQDNMRQLEQRALDLEEELREVRGQQVVLKYEQQRRQLEDQIDALRSESAVLDGTDPDDEARLMRDRLLFLERQAEMQARAIELERHRLEQTAETEMLLRRRVLKIEEMKARGDGWEAERLLERDEIHARMEMLRADAQARMNDELAKLRRLAIDLERDGRVDESREVELRIESLRRQIETELGRVR